MELKRVGRRTRALTLDWMFEFEIGLDKWKPTLNWHKQTHLNDKSTEAGLRQLKTALEDVCDKNKAV